MTTIRTLVACFVIGGIASAASAQSGGIRGQVRDAASGRLLPARVYIQSADGNWHHPRSASAEGSAVDYQRQRITPASNEYHTTLSAHPFVADVPPGRYTLTVERGKEFLPVVRVIEVGNQPYDLTVDLHRWVDMAALGWFSGDTHVHRSLEELPNVMLAEDLNVALPLTSWVTVAGVAPAAGDKNTPSGDAAKVIRIDDTHVIWPINTEYELTRYKGQRHVLGAVFVLNHKKPLQSTAPPVGAVAREAREQGALLDLDKHSWPWSLMLVPIMNVDLFEVTNNHVWRTQFGFRDWTFGTLPDYMNVQTDERGFTEWGWIDFGMQNWYALLNCGFRMRPSAGTASGVHPVPLGFGRVYVHQPDGFSFENWMSGLDAGRSFVTTGPMLMCRFNRQPHGYTFAGVSGRSQAVKIEGRTLSAAPLGRIEIIINGRIAQTVAPRNRPTATDAYESTIDAEVTVTSTSWIALRCFEDRPDGRIRFAHTSVVWVDMPGKPLRPRRAEVEYLITRMEEELARNRDVFEGEAVAEYERALEIYRRIAEAAQ